MDPVAENIDPGFGLLDPLFDEFASIRRDHRKKRIRRCQALIDDWVLWKRRDSEHQRRFSHRFHPLTLITIKETDHSALLGELLDPGGNHGQGGLFLESFLTWLGVPEPTLGHWIVTVETGRIDILLRRQEPASVVIIENKPHDARDQPNQLYRYWLQMIHKIHPQLDYVSPETRARFKVLFLPSERFRAPSQESLSKPVGLKDDPALPDQMPLPVEILPYARDMAGWLEGMIEEVPAENVRLRTFLQFYLENWRNR